MVRLQPFYNLPSHQWALVDDSTNFDRREPIRQWILNELIQTYQYPKAWVGERIIFENSSKFYGISLLTCDGDPFIHISISTDSDNAQQILRSKLLDSYTAGTGIATNGDLEGTFFLRRRFDSNKCDYISDIPLHSISGSGSGYQPYLFNPDESQSRTNKNLTPLSEKIEGIFFEAHSHIRDTDGLHADESLDELCKILYTKMYDEEVANELNPLRFQKWQYGSSEELAATIRAMYRAANEYDVRVYSLRIPGYNRSRGVFNQPIRLSSPALARIVATLQPYSLTSSNSDIKGRVFQRVLTPATRSGMGQYFTPEPVVDFMVSATQPKLSDLILDPFCGSGRFLARCMHYVNKHIENLNDKKWHEFAFGKLHGIEKSDRMVRIAMTDMRLNGDGHSNIRCTDSLLDFANYPDLQPESFDLVLTNPPFGSVIRADAIAQLGNFNLSYRKRSVPIEILGLERSLQFLRQGGRIGIVLPESVLANHNTQYVRTWLEKQVRICGIVSLPIETFSPFGANIKTSILFARKWLAGEKRSRDYPYF